MNEHQIEFVIEDDDAGEVWWRCCCGADADGYGDAVEQAALAAGEHQLPDEVTDEIADDAAGEVEDWREAIRAAMAVAAQEDPAAWVWLPVGILRT